MKRLPTIVPWLVVLVGCSGPSVGAVRDGGQEIVDTSSADITANDVVDVPGMVDAGTADVADATPTDAASTDVADAIGSEASDVVDANDADVVSGDVLDVVDTGSTDVTSTDVVDVATVDVPDVLEVGIPDAGSSDAGPVTMRFEFVSSTPAGSAGGVSMQSVIVWHGSHRGSGGGISFEGWFQ